MQRLWADAALECKGQLDGVVCLVDALYGLQRLDPPSMHYAMEAARQVALADVVVVNKLDLVDGRVPPALLQVLQGINPMASVRFAEYSRVPLELVLKVGEYRKLGNDATSCLSDLFTSTLPSHSTTSGIRNFSIFKPGLMDLQGFEQWLFTLLWEKKVSVGALAYDLSSADIMRVKGNIAVGSSVYGGTGGGVYALQVVQEMYDLFKLNVPFDERPHSRLVFIGI